MSDCLILCTITMYKCLLIKCSIVFLRAAAFLSSTFFFGGGRGRGGKGEGVIAKGKRLARNHSQNRYWLQKTNFVF